jgi:DNA-directed RNA polymerase specialized sigma24 family protein
MIADIETSSEPRHHRRVEQNVVSTTIPERPEWHTVFLRMVPKIRQHAQVRFRHLNPDDRDEAVQEVIARALLDFLRLLERGKGDLAYASPLARFAVAQVRQGRRVGGRLNLCDVSSQYCQAHNSVSLKSLDCGGTSFGWEEVLVENRCSTPAEIAAARIDFRAWLKTLPTRNRHLAEQLATGESTSNVAVLFGISSARVSQLRRELHDAWHVFQAEPVPELIVCN